MIAWIFIVIQSHSSPHPAMGSSEFIKINSSLFRSEHGFSMSSRGTNWSFELPDRPESLIYRVYRAPGTTDLSQATLSVRVEDLEKKMKIKSYVKRWVREYPYYGFKLLKSKIFKHRGAKGYLVDILSEEREHRLRQAVFVKDRKAVVLTCSDGVQTFRETVRDCNKIIRSFSWM